MLTLVCFTNQPHMYFTVVISSFFSCADSSSAAPCCGSSAEEHHLHAGALWQLHRATGETPPKHLQVRPAETLKCNSIPRVTTGNVVISSCVMCWFNQFYIHCCSLWRHLTDATMLSLHFITHINAFDNLSSLRVFTCNLLTRTFYP